MRVMIVDRYVCVSAATYLVCESKVRYYKVLYGVPNACIVWISPKPLCLPVLASFADSICCGLYTVSL